jgi:hypothetical protein
MSLVTEVSFWMQNIIYVCAAIWLYNSPAYPLFVQFWIVVPLGVITLACTDVGFSLNPAGSLFVPWTVAILIFASVPPLIGLLESRLRANGQAVYSTRATARDGNRFPGHLVSNVAGAVAAASLVWAVRTTQGFGDFLGHFSNFAAFNIALPLVCLVILAFVRVQQIGVCPDIDARVKSDPDWERSILGYSYGTVINGPT